MNVEVRGILQRAEAKPWPARPACLSAFPRLYRDGLARKKQNLQNEPIILASKLFSSVCQPKSCNEADPQWLSQNKGDFRHQTSHQSGKTTGFDPQKTPIQLNQ